MTARAPEPLPQREVRRSRWSAVLRDLNPGVFAFVMATGIVSTALRNDNLLAASDILLLIGVAGYIALIATFGWRLLSWRRRLLADLVSPRGFAFLTFVAASNVLASRLAADGQRWPAAVLLAIGVLSWLVLGYGVPLGLIADPRRHPTLSQVNGTWFIWVVGTESIAVAAASLPPFGPVAAVVVFASVCWAIGLMLYLLLAALGLARLLTQPVRSAELIPPYWVFMGAAAITVLAGARLLGLPDVARLLPHDVIAGVSMVLWSFCTWLIPLLLALGVWRHLVRRVSLRYESGLWSMVFPHGMYGVASDQLGSRHRHAMAERTGRRRGVGGVRRVGCRVRGHAGRGRRRVIGCSTGALWRRGPGSRAGWVGDGEVSTAERDADVGE
ncbi:tellurite resistance/C4-dicarboxylate transporter family protein [Kutzneria sp. 744]|uniref:tellurite resistance/C4-dicarboxylate transporter family protein n=1 Tax=Kutzneria sp. (strain 744) TaxID=345341 RepID=UPI0007C5B385|nr:tellurite resistance/C4-dicarboxylate transporter family protein [Kutzneria sp. 744]